MSNNQIYTTEFRQGAIEMVVEQQMSCSEVGRRLGTSAKNVSRWVRNYLSKTSPVSAQQSDSELTRRVRDLEKENKQLRMEREILKKAAAFFANESR